LAQVLVQRLAAYAEPASKSGFPFALADRAAPMCTGGMSSQSQNYRLVSASAQSMEVHELPPLGTPQQITGTLTAWIVD